MAKSVALGLAILSVLLVLAPSISLSTHNPGTKEFTVYAYVINQGPGANIIPVAGNPSSPMNSIDFGRVFVFDAPLRKTISTDSPVIGQTQGINVISSLNATRAYLSFSLIFGSGEYRGSTLQLQGSLEVSGVAFRGELAVVSGSRSFRNAYGYGFIQTVFQNPTTLDAVQKLQVFIKQDHD